MFEQRQYQPTQRTARALLGRPRDIENRPHERRASYQQHSSFVRAHVMGHARPVPGIGKNSTQRADEEMIKMDSGKPFALKLTPGCGRGVWNNAKLKALDEQLARNKDPRGILIEGNQDANLKLTQNIRRPLVLRNGVMPKNLPRGVKIIAEGMKGPLPANLDKIDIVAIGCDFSNTHGAKVNFLPGSRDNKMNGADVANVGGAGFTAADAVIRGGNYSLGTTQENGARSTLAGNVQSQLQSKVTLDHATDAYAPNVLGPFVTRQWDSRKDFESTIRPQHARFAVHGPTTARRPEPDVSAFQSRVKLQQLAA